ncbi:protein FAM3C isoform X2 [Dicentrarchus labrax]|uniref:protein FAM3C isoform X2 n=2 Tax=Dicentrarchus labrax TaxID=13489 RepID=UPI0021F51D12|nr:protein FAM3C isoform X2 [Dicentrarchus labrax]
MLTVRVGKAKMRRVNIRGWAVQCMFVFVPLVLFVMLILQYYGNPFEDWRQVLPADMLSQSSMVPPKQSAGPCVHRTCPEDNFSFSIQSGAANVVGPKICVQKKLVLGTMLNNAGYGINIVIINGKTGEVIKTDHFDMYSGDVKPLIELLKSIETGSVVLMASYDDPSSKLDEEARKLIAELGSSSVKSLGFRDNWIFVGGKGAGVKSNFEKYMKNDNSKNKYENWPEIIQLEGCIPKYLD